jgi:stage V sporulation protein B
VKIAAVLGFGSTALFTMFPHQLSMFFFKNNQAGDLLFALALACIFHFLQVTLFSISNGLGMQSKVLSYSIIEVIILVVCAYALIPIPTLNIYGYIIGFNGSSLLITLINAYDLKKIKQLNFRLFRLLIRPFISFLMMMVALHIVYEYFVRISTPSEALLPALAAGLAVYAAALLFTGTFTMKQISNTLNLK